MAPRSVIAPDDPARLRRDDPRDQGSGGPGGPVRILEARFRSAFDANDEVVVGYVVCGAGGPVVRVASDLSQVSPVPATLASKLRHLVALVRDDPFDGLRAIVSQHWSFVETRADALRRGALED